MSNRSTHATTVTERILAHAHELGFDLASLGPAQPPSSIAHYRHWIEQGYHGEMAYLARSDAVAKRADLGLVLPGLRSILTVGANYHVCPLPPDLRDDPSRGVIATYAWPTDYHAVLGERLRRLAAWIVAEVGQPVVWHACTDSCSVLERDLAQGAGLGFIGKNTNLINPSLGSWMYLGELLLTAELPRGLSLFGQWQGLSLAAAEGTCGRCNRCMKACPTGALVAPFVLDARRCISYLTIELKGPIPHELRPLMANHIFGCDICQEVCPWNRRFARSTSAMEKSGPELMAPPLLELLALDSAAFSGRFRSSALQRAKRRGVLRNVAVALGNWGHPAATALLRQSLSDAEPLIRGHSAWALGRIADEHAGSALRVALKTETDGWVRDEMRGALAHLMHR